MVDACKATAKQRKLTKRTRIDFLHYQVLVKLLSTLQKEITICLKPLFQSEAKIEAIDMKMIFFTLMRKKLLPIGKILHLASFTFVLIRYLVLAEFVFFLPCDCSDKLFVFYSS